MLTSSPSTAVGSTFAVGSTPGGGAVRLVRTPETLPTAHVLGRISSELMEMQPRIRIRGDAFRELVQSYLSQK